MSEDLLKVRNLTKKFGTITALNNVSLEIRNNEMFALLGPSGCGKTTLLRIIAGFEYPDSGQVLINDSDLLSIPTRTRPVNLMFQSYALFPHMDIFSNISYGLTNTSLTKEEINNQTNEIIEKSPFESWTLVNGEWQAPVQYPNDGKIYSWNEDLKNWIEY